MKCFDLDIYLAAANTFVNKNIQASLFIY